MAQPDVSVVIVFHDEGGYAIPALASMKDSVEVARAGGIHLETRAILDRPDRETSRIVRRCGSWLNAIDEVSFGDLGLTRNAAVHLAQGTFIAFLDGDDLWGNRWISEAYQCATRRTQAIWHPQYIYYFDDDGYNHHSVTATPNRWCRAHYSVQIPSDAEEFDPRALIFANAWTANALAPRDVHLQCPYDPVDLARGIGFEDWGWNIKTLNCEIPHLVVKSTVHAVRRRSGSLSMSMKASGVLPAY